MSLLFNRRSSRALLYPLLCLFLLSPLFSATLYAEVEGAEVISTGSERSWLGLTTRELDEYTARMLAIDPGEFKGLVVIDVIRGGPADESGIARGDVILSIDDKEIPGYEDFKVWLNELDIGSTLKLLVDKGGTVKDILVTLGSMPAWPEGADSFAVGMKGNGTYSDELHAYYWMGEAQQYDYFYSVAMGGLDLTPKQRREARSIMSSYEKKMLRYSADINVAEVELRERLEDEPVRLKEVREKISDIARKRTELRYLRVKTHVSFKKLLTGKQQRLVDEFISVRGGRRYSISD